MMEEINRLTAQVIAAEEAMRCKDEELVRLQSVEEYLQVYRIQVRTGWWLYPSLWWWLFECALISYPHFTQLMMVVVWVCPYLLPSLYTAYDGGCLSMPLSLTLTLHSLWWWLFEYALISYPLTYDHSLWWWLFEYALISYPHSTQLMMVVVWVCPYLLPSL